MPVRKTPLVTGETYHVFNRGINKRKVYLNKRDYAYMHNIIEYYSYTSAQMSYSKFKKLAQYKRNELWKILREENRKMVNLIAFCLMPNHFHLVTRQNVDGGISRYLRNIQNSYALYFNIKNKRAGPLFQGRYKAIRIADEEQLMHVVRYVHLNPFTSHLIRKEEIKNYAWSSLPQYLNKAQCFCEKEIVLDNIGSKNKYLNHVLDYADFQRELKKIKDLTFELQ